MPAGHTIGETVGVAINSKKHLFVYTRSGNVGPARGAQAAELFEFDETGKYVKEWGQNAYGFSFAHAIRFDKDDNLWVIDEGSNMVMKFNPQGLVTMVLGRKDEAVDYLERFLEEGRQDRSGACSPAGAGAGRGGSFGRPTDVAFDTQGNIFVADGYYQLTRRQVHQGRRLRQVDRHARQRAGAVQHAAHHRQRRQGQHLRRRPRQPAHPGVRSGPEPGPHHQQRARAVGDVHHAAQRAGPAVPLQRRRGRQDLQGRPRGPSARLVRHDSARKSGSSTGCTRCTASARTRSTPARRRTGASSASR